MPGPPGVTSGGTPRRSFNASYTTRGGTTFGVSRGGSIGIDTSDLTQLHKSLNQIDDDIKKLVKTVDSLTNSLTNAGSAANGLTGAGTAKGSSKNTAAGFSGPFAGGSGSKAVGLAALGEIGSQWAGGINSYMSTFQSNGMATNLIAQQQNLVFGTKNTAANVTATTKAYAGISNMSLSDLAQGLNTITSNPLLRTKTGSTNQKNMIGFLNAVQKLNPSMGASGAASFANQLASGSGLLNINTFSGPGTGLIQTAPQGGGVNTAQQTFRALLNMVSGGTLRNASAAQIKSFGRNNAYWAQVQQSSQAPGGSGLSNSQLQEIQQFALAGGNLTTAEASMGPSAMQSMLNRTTASSATAQSVFESSQGGQEAVNNAVAGFTTEIGKATRALGPLTNILVGIAHGSSPLLNVASKGAEGAGFATGLLGIFKKIIKPVAAVITNPVVDEVAETAGEAAVMAGDPTGSTSTAGMHPALKSRVSAMMAANPNLRINSGHRTRQQQRFLHALKGGRGVAKPGHSMHEHGLAADIGPASQMGWIAKNAHKFGLSRPDRNEPWHVQMGDPASFTSTNWAEDYLNQLPGAAKATGPNDPRVKFLKAMIQEEGTFNDVSSKHPIGNRNNPLDIEGQMYGGYSGLWNPQGVTMYNSLKAGFNATNDFMFQQNDASLYSALKSPRSTMSQLVGSVSHSAWSSATGAIAQDAGSPITLTGMRSGVGGTPGGGKGLITSLGRGSNYGGSGSNPLLNALFGALTQSSLSDNFLQQTGGSWLSGISGGQGTSNPGLMAALHSLAGSRSLSSLLGEVGDPAAVTSPMLMGDVGGGARYVISMPLQVVQATEAEAERLVTMVMQKFQQKTGVSGIRRS